MSGHTVPKLIAFVAALVAAVSWLLAGHYAAQAGHTHGGNHCLSAVPNNTCRYIYSLQGENLLGPQKSFHLWNFRFASRWSDGPYEAALDVAEMNWGKTVGPQAPSEPVSSSTGLSIDDNYYYSCPEDGNPGGGSCGLAYTCRVDIAYEETCDPADAVNIAYGRIFINHDSFLALDDPIYQANVMAHEMGHTLGLTHHNQSSCLMFPFVTQLTGPQQCDLGFANPLVSPKVGPCDGSSDDYGIRCIYWWYREQGPDWDCFDVNRDGVVDLFNDVVTTISAFGSEAGEPDYHPDADINFDGVIDLFNDIVGVGQQVGDVCAVDHYPQS